MFVPNAISAVFACNSVVTNPMFVANAISAVFHNKSLVTNPMFVLNAISAAFRVLKAQIHFMRQGSDSKHAGAISSTEIVF